ncbi:MAG: hypothetical protein JW786_12690 [Desulfobacterales bacterium]|nr:hypothetical protein [Desulfobacterales bacterium]
MNKLQKFLGIGAIIFVVIYLGAVVITVQSRTRIKDRTTTIESTRAVEEERHLMLPELLLPMGILFTLAVSYLIVKRRNRKKYMQLDKDIDEEQKEDESLTGLNVSPHRHDIDEVL